MVRLPLWVRWADVIVVVLTGLAVSVLLFGGFRTNVADAPVSVTDWWRPALWALGLAAVRHWKVPSEPLWQRVGAAVRRRAGDADVREVVPVVLATRVGVLAVGALAVVTIGFSPDKPPPFRVYPDNVLLDLPARYDAGWYLGIATSGYRYREDGGRGQQNIVFFPAYPLLVRYLSMVTGRQPLWAGVVLSMAAFCWALVYLRRLARDDLGNDEQAATAVLLLASYPFAVFFSAMYTDALFLLAMVATLYHFRRDQLWRVVFWGMLAGLTRPNGAFLSVVLGLMVAAPVWSAWRRGEAVAWLRQADRLAAAAAPGIGMLCYSSYILFLTGHPFQWAAQNAAAWGREYRPLYTVVTDRASFVADHGLYAYVTTQPIDFSYFLAALLTVAAVWPVFRRFGLPYAVLLLVMVLPPLAMGGLLSIGRFSSVLFPIFLWLAAVIPARQRTAWVAVFALLQGFMAVLFFTWRPVF